MKNKILLVCAPLSIIPIVPSVVSCSSSSSSEELYSASSNTNIYSNIWNLAVLDELDNNFLDITIDDLAQIINKGIKADSKNDLSTKLYCFTTLWNAFKNPLTRDGKYQSNLSSSITDFSTFLSDKVVADNKDEKNNDKKTYNNFKNYINKIEYKIEILNFDKITSDIDNTKTLREVLNKDKYLLNFQFKYKINDEETNTKMVSSTTGKSIMFKINIDRSERIKINKTKNAETKKLVTDQFAYQSTKLIYDVESKWFSTIILCSNVNSTDIKNNIEGSGFSTDDKKRALFLFDWKAENEDSKNYSSWINFKLSAESNFNISLNSDWTNFLKKEGLVDDKNKMRDVEINLNKNFYYDKSTLE